MSIPRPLPAVRVAMPVRVARYQRGAMFGPRLLPDHELFWMLSGSVVHSYETPWGAKGEVTLKPGTLSLSVKGMTDTYSFDRRSVSTHAYIHFDFVDPEESVRLGPATSWPSLADMQAWPTLATLAQYTVDLAGDRSEAALERTQHCAGLMLDMIIRGPLVESREPEPRLDAMIEYVATEWARHGLSVMPGERLAGAIGLSRGYLSVLCTRHYGCGPAELLETVRLAQAAVMLQRSNSTVAEVSTECGFTSQFHFSRRFKRMYGQPPGAFRHLTQTDPYGPLRERQILGVAHRLLHVRTWN